VDRLTGVVFFDEKRSEADWSYFRDRAFNLSSPFANSRLYRWRAPIGARLHETSFRETHAGNNR
jgi:hypothetical protein